MLDPDRIAAALRRLHPESRALVELSYRRGLGDDEIADLLGVGREEVARRREAVVARIGTTGERLSQLDDEHWDPQARPATAGQLTPRDSAARRTTRPGALALAALGLVLAIVLIAALASGGDDDGSGESAETPAGDVGATTKTEQETAAAESSPARRMQRLNGTYGHGTAQVVQEGGEPVLRLRVSDFLQPEGGGYAVWLHNSGDDGRRLYATTRTTIERDLPLPGDYADFRYVEVARAIPDLDSDHSGISLLRARVDALR